LERETRNCRKKKHPQAGSREKSKGEWKGKTLKGEKRTIFILQEMIKSTHNSGAGRRKKIPKRKGRGNLLRGGKVQGDTRVTGRESIFGEGGGSVRRNVQRTGASRPRGSTAFAFWGGNRRRVLAFQRTESLLGHEHEGKRAIPWKKDREKRTTMRAKK